MKPAEVKLREANQRLAEAIGGLMPPGVGFGLFMFHFGPGGFMSYASNSDRKDFIRAVREWLARVED